MEKKLQYVPKWFCLRLGKLYKFYINIKKILRKTVAEEVFCNQCCGSASASAWIRMILVSWIRIRMKLRKN